MVTIIGGGIAGTVLGGALARQGEPVTMYERQRRGAEGGAFLFVDGRGHSVLHELGVADEVVDAASFPVTALEYAGSDGRRAAMSRGHRFWLHSSLMRVLGEFLGTSGADVRYGQAVTGVALDGGETRLTHGDGSSGTADGTVIAADGIDSVVRARLEPDRVPVYAGDVVLYGRTEDPLALDTDAQILHFFAELDETGSAASTFGHIWRPGDAAHWFIRIARDPLDGPDDLGMRPTEEWHDTVLRATPSITDMVETLLDRTDSVHVSNARDVPLDTAAPPTLPVLLIGDADHAITPAAGVGARDALEDAHAVYTALTTGTCPAEAMSLRRTTILEDRQRALRNRASVSR
ncbi:FAD-dependent monooxygenase [Nocardia puris]|uniref:FAD-dependent monooxygenase n=1 Tax=Nocardia puris TaxID=208602 RepID=UPI001893E4D8|nr:FAD-dependent monooxygenase [Nocardia puris]MBF6213992.1 FAD-dependent monooxygenase [Nocardia puris]MBF6368712.1 FAD-dependent monooxygenase [Nocardia puris]MBF6461627.1 FAD-dependent monooxygenase [Nocardia puris]